MSDDFESRYEAQQAMLREHGFDPTVAHLGEALFGAFGGLSKAAMCLTCFALVPVVKLTDGSQATERHRATHGDRL